MTEVETKVMLRSMRADRFVFRRKKTKMSRDARALMLIGAMAEMHAFIKTFEQGNEQAQMMAEFCKHRMDSLRKHLREV